MPAAFNVNIGNGCRLSRDLRFRVTVTGLSRLVTDVDADVNIKARIVQFDSALSHCLAGVGVRNTVGISRLILSRPQIAVTVAAQVAEKQVQELLGVGNAFKLSLRKIFHENHSSARRYDIIYA